MSNPYAQQPPVQRPPAQQYGQQAPAYGQQPPVQQYGQQAPAYGQQPPVQQYSPQAPAYGQQAYASTGSNVSAIILTILSGVSLLFCNLLAIGSGALGIIALTKNSTDPEGSRHLAKIGWIVFAVVWALAIIGLIVWVIAIANSGGSTTRSNFSTGV